MIATWTAHRLERKLSAALGASLVVVSVVFLVALVALYRDRLLTERSDAAAQVNGLLVIALENAMLKRDLEGLQHIVARLGSADRVLAVAVLDPRGEVRFASDPRTLGRRLDPRSGEDCFACEPLDARAEASATFRRSGGREVLRSIHPVRNREACAGCHGPAAAQPINGVLVVDYDAASVRRAALAGAGMLSGAGALVVAVAIAALWWVVRRLVLRPLGRLSQASRALADGDLDSRSRLAGSDEIAELGHTFDAMAARLQASLGALASRERFLQDLIDAIPDGVRVIDDRFVVRRANRAFVEQAGLTAADVVGRPCYASSHGRDEPCAATLVTCPVVALSEASAPLVCRHRHVRPDGGEYFVEVNAAPLHSQVDGRPERLVIEAIRDLTREMSISQEQRLSEIGLLAAGVAHEIRNPLTSLRLGLRALERDGGRDRGGYLAALEHEIDSCIEITDRLLKLSAPPASRPELVALDVITREVMSLLRAEAEATGITVELRLDEALRVLATDSDMRTLILNLAQNAFHAMPQGGRLVIAGTVVEDEVRVEVTDTGVGIRAADLGRIFDPFWSRRADGRRGTGLGLSICRAIVRGCGGRIDVQSEVGAGARFVVSIPWADREQAAA